MDNSSSMSVFRPIAFCNTIYKCINKIIASRIKSTLPSLISPTQFAFVPRRKINANILITQELYRNYQRATGQQGVL